MRTALPKESNKAVGPGHIVGGDGGIDIRTMNQLSNMMASSVIDGLASTSSSRSVLARRLGYEYQGDRDVYTALGYTKTLQWEDYFGKYQRGDIARRIVKEPVLATWRSVPTVNETLPKEKRGEVERTPFEVAWDALVGDKNLKVWHNIRKADLVSGIGRWGVLFLGFNDAEKREDFASEVTHGSKLLYLTPLNESQSMVSSVVNDATDPRFGKPEFYELSFQSTTASDSQRTTTVAGRATTTQTVRVHWSRIIHLAEEADESGVVGAPRLEAVFNRLLDLDRVVGSSGEAFWRNAFPGMNFKLDKDSQFTDEQELEELKTQMDKFVHRWERHIRTKGIDIQELATQVASPKDSFEVIISIVSSTTGIPQRILLGSERGELASTQDQTQYGLVIQERRVQYVEPVILDQFIMRLIGVGTLPTPAVGWSYVWAGLFAPSERDKATVAKLRTESLVRYADSMGASSIIPMNVFLRSEKFLDFTEDEAKKIEDVIEESAQDELNALKVESDDIDDEEDIVE